MVNLRRTIEQQYSGVCTISEFKEFKRANGSTGNGWVPVHENIPCQLSHSRINTTNPETSAANVEFVIKLFINPDLEIKPGSKIEVTQNSRTNKYERSGEPAIYPTHQEIMLELVGEKA